MKLSKKQNQLINDIQDTKDQEIYVEGSTQSGKTCRERRNCIGRTYGNMRM